MAKFRLSSLLTPGSSSKENANAKKQNRRSFSAFSEKPATKPAKKPEGQTNGSAVTSAKPDVTTAADAEAVEAPSRMVILSQTIAKETEKLEAYFKVEGLPLPSFDPRAPSDLPKLPEDIEASRREIIYATRELRNLAIGPRESIRWGTWGVCPFRLPLTICFLLERYVISDMALHTASRCLSFTNSESLRHS